MAVSRSPLFNGQAPLFDAAAQWGIGRVELDGYVESRPHCSGFMIGADTAITARHCLSGESSMYFWVRDSRRAVAGTRIHPSEDLALLELATSCAEPFGRLRLAKEPPSVGADVWLAGYGKTEDGSGGELRLAKSRVARLSEYDIEVSSEGANGACIGDSGGPLLSTVEAGMDTVALGVLVKGSASCLGEDSYVRADAVLDWIGAGLYDNW